MQPQLQTQTKTAGVQTTPCLRCGRPCRVAGPTPEDRDSVLIRKSDKPHGCCAGCAMTCFLKTSPVADVIPGGRWSVPGFDVGQVFRLEHVRDQVAAVCRAAGCEPAGGEIDWEGVIANWDLTVPDGWDWGGEIYKSKPTRGRRRA